MKEANIDAELMTSLGESIRNFEGAAKGIAPTADAIQHTKKYSEELSQAAAQMESLNLSSLNGFYGGMLSAMTRN